MGVDSELNDSWESTPNWMIHGSRLRTEWFMGVDSELNDSWESTPNWMIQLGVDSELNESWESTPMNHSVRSNNRSMSLEHSVWLSLKFPAGLGLCIYQRRVLFYINNTISCVSGTWSSSCVGPGSCLQACNSRTIGLSSTDEILMYVWVLLKDSSSAHWDYLKYTKHNVILHVESKLSINSFL